MRTKTKYTPTLNVVSCARLQALRLLRAAYLQGQRDAEQRSPADADRWAYTGKLALEYFRGYVSISLAGRRRRHDRLGWRRSDAS